jgi:hypothetical protein
MPLPRGRDEQKTEKKKKKKKASAEGSQGPEGTVAPRWNGIECTYCENNISSIDSVDSI